MNDDTRRWQLALTLKQAEILYRALGIWSSDYNDAPEFEIEELRERLRKMGVK